ncbi:MAG: KpsF/GutQ family sugar-phosphate isomerase [Deltaproteobacteria bacterium]|jgi:arabinose-5-phosphate isomerase|nr:KpsF/GutQ family sugar-phosphate isomerase [Deltaproteobacteria bacterium]
MQNKKDWLPAARQVLDVEIEGLKAVREHLGPSFNEAVDLLAACGGRVVLTGVGKSGLVGRKLAATLSSTGTPAFFLHPVEGQHGDLGSIRPEDVVIAISNSGNTDELNAILPVLRSLGVKIIGLTGGLDSTLATLSDIVLDAGVPREACPFNLAPTSSTTAVLALGDALAVCLIEYKSFTEKDFKRVHPGGSLGQRLREPVDSLMHTENIPVAGREASLAEAVEALNRGGLGTVLLLDPEGRVDGIFTDGDLRRTLCRGSFDPDAPVFESMTRQFCHARPGQNLAEVLDLMESRSITVLPVLDSQRRPLGVLHLHDVLGKGKIRFS